MFCPSWSAILTIVPRLPLNTLPAFRSVAELQNLRAAADVLHLTHSAVSQQIRGLEEQLGFELFERRGRRVVINAAGEALLRSVQAAEQNLGLAIGFELLAADALRDGRLVKLSPLSITYEHSQPYHVVYPPSLRDWPPLVALRKWLHDELDVSRKALHPTAGKRNAKSRRA